MTGPTGPFGAVVRFQPQDLHVWHSAGQIFESGNGTITWNGRDMDGNAVGDGYYEFDVIAWNTIDKAALAAAGSQSAFTDNTIDLRQDPPEVWAHVYDRDREKNSIKFGDIYRSLRGGPLLWRPARGSRQHDTLFQQPSPRRRRWYLCDGHQSGWQDVGPRHFVGR